MKIDYETLKKISLDNKNKFVQIYDDSVTLSSFLKLISNIIYEMKDISISEVALFVNSLNHWITNKTFSSTANYKPGTVIEFECGLNYSDETSYRHTGLVIEEFDRKILVVPSRSSEKLIKKSSEKENGLWYYVLINENYHFDHECVLLLDDMKTISKKRVINSFGNILDSDDGKLLFDQIKLNLLSHYFPKQYQKTLNELADLRKKIKELEEQNRRKAEKITSLYGKINFLYKKYGNKKS